MRSRCLLMLVLACLWPVSSNALGFTLGMVDGDVMTPTEMMLGCGMPDEDGITQCSGMNMASENGDWTLTSWTLNLDPDPFVFANTVIQNTTGTTQTFFLNVVLPISPVVGPPLVISGSVQGGVTDTGGVGGPPGAPGNGALLSSAAPTAIYSAAIDSLVVQTLLNDPSSVSAGAFGSNSFIPSPSFLNVVLPGNTAATNIAIFLRFNLSAGDSATFTSVFNVIPEPSTAVLGGLGLLGLLAAGRRRKADR